MSKSVTLVSPNGREYTTDHVAEITRLKAAGYTEKPAPAPKAPTK